MTQVDGKEGSMSGSKKYSRIKAGSFSLPLAINQQFLDRDLASTLIRQHEVYLLENEGRPYRFAICNFLAIFHFRVGNVFKACEYFRRTLKDDKSNVNALSDLAYVYQKLYQHSDAEKLLSTLKSLTELPENANSSERDLFLKRQSRCTAETGYMYAHDLFKCTISTEKHKQACDMYSDAIRISNQVVVDEDEVQDWKFYRGLLYRSMYNIEMDFNARNFETIRDLYKMAREDFEANMNASNKHRKADAYSNLGSVLAKCHSRGMCRHDNFDIKKRWHKKKTCECLKKIHNLYKTALCDDPGNIRTYVRYGRELMHSNQYEDALLRFNQAIVLDESSANWFAYSSRALVYTKKYTRGKDKGYLILAEADLLKSVKGSPSPIDMGRLGHVYHLLGSNHKKSSATDSEGKNDQNVATNANDDKNYLLKALHYFMNATEIADGNQRTDIHFNRGNCLLDMNEIRGAVESFKKALECEQPKCKTLKNIESLIFSLFRMFNQVEEKNRKEILAELCYWWRRGLENKRVDEFVNKKKNAAMMLKLLEVLLKYQESDVDQVLTTSLKDILSKNKHKQKSVERILSKTSQENYFSDAANGDVKATAEDRAAVANDTTDAAVANVVDITDKADNVAVHDVNAKDNAAVANDTTDAAVANVVNITDKADSVAVHDVNAKDNAAVANDNTDAAVANVVDITDKADEVTVHDVKKNTAVAAYYSADTADSTVNALDDDEDTVNTAANDHAHTADDDADVTKDASNVAKHASDVTKSPLKRSESRTMLTIGSDGISISPVKDHPSQHIYPCLEEQKCCSIADVVLFICKQLDVQNTKRTGLTIPHPPTSSKSRFPYDFLVVFSTKQTQWVYYSLLARLEQTYRFKGCIPDRDFVAGKTACDNINESVKNSACTLVVIDKEFCEDMVLRHRLTYAYYINARLKRRLIPILKEEPRDVPMEICNLTPLNATTTINLEKLARDIEIASLDDRVEKDQDS